jgi:glycosyltransferase involved in cell wall biosynthesis
MKIAIIDPSLFTLPYDHQLCHSLGTKGLEVFLVGSKDINGYNISSDQYTTINHYYKITNKLKGKNTRKFNKVRLLIKGIEHLIDTLLLIRKIKKMKPEIVHFQWLPLPLIDRILIKSIMKNYKLVLTVHDTNLFLGSASSKLQLIGFNNTVSLFDKIIVHTNYSKNKLEEKQIVPPDKIAVVPHGIFNNL